MQADSNVPFGVAAMYAAYLPIQVLSTDATFCSKHVTKALQYALLPELMSLNPALVTPSSLYRSLVSSQGQGSPIVQVVPGKMTTDKSISTANFMAKDMVLSFQSKTRVAGG
jgi:hypothetical protein